ncbi:hypothetical protein C0995_008373 [Termitomyces sp. Mi166|nr:hypothetical protein C0995_008373 [Termitomyces sp. Mi166\
MAPLTISSTLKLSSGHDIPLLGFGVFQNYDCVPAVEAALKAGYTHIDTAQMYRNEEQVGAAVKASGIPRESIWITLDSFDLASKVFQTGDRTTASLQSSLKNLDLGYIDLYLIHSGHGGKDVRLQTYKTLLEFSGPEKPIRSIGVDIHHLEEIREAGLPTPTVNQIEQKPIVEYCRAHGIAVSAYCPLVRGNFGNPVLQEVAKEVDKTPAQVLIRWSIQKGFVPLPKSAHPARVVSNADIYDFELSDLAMAKLDALDRGSDGAISWNPTDVD